MVLFQIVQDRLSDDVIAASNLIRLKYTVLAKPLHKTEMRFGKLVLGELREQDLGRHEGRDQILSP
jgi:hypothetical protein